VRRIALAIATVGFLCLSVSAAHAGWVWRDGKWVYDTTRTQAPPRVPDPDVPAPDVPTHDESKDAPATPEAKPAEPQPKPSPEPKPDATKPPAREPADTGTAGSPTELPDSMKPDRPEEEEPWYERAKWWKKPPPPGKDQPMLEQAQADFAAGKKRRAEKRFRDLIDDYPQSRYREQAMWLRAESLFSRQRYYEAYEQYEDLIEQYAGSARYQDALNREVEIAELYFGPVRRRVLGIPLMSGEDEAVEILRRVYEHQPTGQLADDVILRIADHHWSKHRWVEAEESYDKYCREYPNGEAVRHAELRRALCGIRQCEGPKYCTTTLRLAADRLRQYQTKYPEEAARNDVPALIDRLTQMQAQSMYEVAARYRRAGKPCAAAFYAERLRERYPNSPWSEKAAEFLAPTTGFGMSPTPPGTGGGEAPATAHDDAHASVKEETQP